MPSKSSGRILKARKNDRSTPHQKNHRWESFSAKVSKFNSLQPLRKVRRHDLENEDLSTATSYFQNGLQKWSELNMSKNFVSFKREVLPLCESLPQILHFEKRIMGSLDRWISTQDKESLEPLLDLLTAFAHDLGVRFEKYYARSLELLLAIAGRPQDVEVIEWTFATLAFLFKYLSKLLVPDLRPTFDAVAPLLGRSRHPPHIARFAAEAMSFLVKKAGAPSHRETSLVALVQHARDDLLRVREDKQFVLYKDGLMTMFAEAIKGTDHSIHSTGAAIFLALADAAPEEEENLSSAATWTDLTCGVLTSVIHHSSSEMMSEFCDQLYDHFVEACSGADSATKSCGPVSRTQILGILAGVRKGSRVSNWQGLTGALVKSLDAVSTVQETSSEQKSDLWDRVVSQVAIICHHAPMDALISRISPLTQLLTRGRFMPWFIPFCAFFCELDATRFGNLFRNEFQKFIAMHWAQGDNEDTLCVLLPRMVDAHGFSSPKDKDCLRLPQGWQDQIVSKFENLEVSPFPEQGPYNKDPQVWRDRCLPKYSALLRLCEIASVHPSTNARIAELLLRKLKLALRPHSSLASDEVRFIVSQGFQAYLRMSKSAGDLDASLSPLLRAAIPRFARSVGFLYAYIGYEQNLQESGRSARQDSSSSDGSVADVDPVIESLVQNLSSSDHDIRLASLKLLHHLQAATDLQLVVTMIEVEELPLSLETSRTIAMLLRKLGQQYHILDQGSCLQQAIASFLFGMLTVKMSPVWDDAVEALKQVSETKAGEEHVSAMAFTWAEVPSMRWTSSRPEGRGSHANFYSAFECTMVNYLREKSRSLLDNVEGSRDLMLQAFDKNQATSEAVAPQARSRALKVFNAIPSMAEKRSRRLVPLFLSWASEYADAAVPHDQSLEDSDGASWSLADRKALLGVFSQFVNPRVLYQHEKVYSGLLQLMQNGDAEVQKLALKAILAWKQDGVKPYQENLEYLLDEARFKNELTVFLQGEMIKPEHREELMPVLLRLLYGRTISKKGAASGRHGLQGTRLAVLRNLSVEDMGGFLGIAVGKLRDIRVTCPKAQRDKVLGEPLISERKQVGFLNMMSALISELGSNVTPYMEPILNSVLYCLLFACRQLRNLAANTENNEDGDDISGGNTSLLRVTRSSGLKCLIALFQNAQDFQWEAYKDLIVEEVVAPRMENLHVETAQGVSGMLQLLSTWSVLPKVALFLGPNAPFLPNGTIPAIIECISEQKAKEDVKAHCLAIVRNLAQLALAPATESEFNEIIRVELLEPNTEAILAAITNVLQSELSPDLLNACVETILSLAPIAPQCGSIQGVTRISSFLLKQPARRVNPKTKGKVLLVIEGFIPLMKAGENAELMQEVYETVSSLFSYFKDMENRLSLCRALAAISASDEDLLHVSALCADLNSFKAGRIEEPDYDKRLAAFTKASSARETSLTPSQWLPLLHNAVFYIRQDEEFGILSSNSADVMRRCVAEASTCQEPQQKRVFEGQLSNVIMPSLYSGAREPSETVRRECLRVLGFLLSAMPEWEPVAALTGLVSERQEDSSEPSFFFNILSPAMSRQTEAIRSLESANAAKEMDSQNLSQFFIPLLEHFIFGRLDGTDDHGLGALATNVIGELAKSLHWRHYRTTLQRYTGYIGSRPEAQKQTIRLLGKFTDALSSTRSTADEAMEIDGGDGGGGNDQVSRRLGLTAPESAQLTKEMLDNFLPPLIKHLHEKDDSEVSYRVPVGVIIVKMLKMVSSDELDQKLAGVLTDICHILRSKATESRDMARDTLCKIAVELGASFFGFILKELRSALTRGYQLHVLSYTMHSMLVAAVPDFGPGDLDYCLPNIVAVIMDDIFGVIGQEKDAEGYISQMKEVKSSKSQDSMELIAKTATISHLIHLVRPLKSMLMQKIDLKVVRKIDALMSRIGAGLMQNAAAESQDTLVFCYEIIQEVYASNKPEAEQKLDPRLKKYLVQRGAKKSGERGMTTKHTYKLTRFAIDILRSMFRKHDELRVPANITGFLPILGDAVLDGEEEVKIAAFRLLTVIIKVPSLGEDGSSLYKVAVKEAIKSISTATSTTTDLAQAALKLLSVVLRERREVIIKDAAVDMLLLKLKDDLTEPLFRHVTFNFLRSVLERRVETAAVYDIMDYVGSVMITNDDKDTRDLARGAFFQFIREYPQKKARWGKQLNFIVANLKYEREGGRLSVMEIVHLLLTKPSEDFVQEVSSTCFLPLFFVLANDDSEKCRAAAGELLKGIFSRAGKSQTQGFLTLVRTWLGNDGNPAVQRLGLQVAGYYFESQEAAARNREDLNLVLSKIKNILATEDVYDIDGDLLDAALGVIQVLQTAFPEKILSSDCEDLWANVARCMRHPQPSAKLSGVRLITFFLTDFAKQGMKQTESGRFMGSSGLEFGIDKAQDLARVALGILSRREVPETLGTETGQLLVFLGTRIPLAQPVSDVIEPFDEEDAEEEDEDEDEATKQISLEYIFKRLSHILRKEVAPRAIAINSKVVAMDVLETICRRLPTESVFPSLQMVLVPLQHLTDPRIPTPHSMDEEFKTKHEGLKTRAQIFMDALQKKFGTAEYTKQLLAVREAVKEKRRQRTSKRKIEALAHPEKYGRDKRKKFEKNQARRRIRSKEQKTARQAYKGW